MTFAEAKDQVAKAHPDHYNTWDELVASHADSHSWVAVVELQDMAAELYAASVREEAVKHSWVNYLGDDGKTCPCSLCGDQTFGKYEGKPYCLRCALRLKCQ
jgi:hypothetical protein